MTVIERGYAQLRLLNDDQFGRIIPRINTRLMVDFNLKRL